MKNLVIILLSLTSGLQAWAQGFEWTDHQEVYQAGLGQTIRIPIRIKNTSDKPQFFIVRRAQSDLGSNQKGYFCLGEACLDPGLDQFSKRIEPGETLNNLFFTVETGFVKGNIPQK